MRLDTDAIFDHEIERIPKKLRKFLIRERPPSVMEQTWGYYQHGYSRGFEALYQAVIQERGWHRHYLALPLFFLCRHSMELAIKAATVAFAEHASETPDLEGHGLAQLWNQLLHVIKAANFELDPDWTGYCNKLVNHIHEVDPDGERFRYPSDVKGVPFEFTRVEIDGLALAHSHINMFCECATAMLEERYECYADADYSESSE